MSLFLHCFRQSIKWSVCSFSTYFTPNSSTTNDCLVLTPQILFQMLFSTHLRLLDPAWLSCSYGETDCSSCMFVCLSLDRRITAFSHSHTFAHLHQTKPLLSLASRRNSTPVSCSLTCWQLLDWSGDVSVARLLVTWAWQGEIEIVRLVYNYLYQLPGLGLQK